MSARLTVPGLNAALAAFTSGGTTRPTYVALFATSPSPETGLGGTEITGVGYSRKLLSWGTPANGVVSVSNVPVVIGPSGSHWGVINAVCLMSAESGGVVLAVIPVNFAVLSNEAVVIEDLRLTFSI